MKNKDFLLMAEACYKMLEDIDDSEITDGAYSYFRDIHNQLAEVHAELKALQDATIFTYEEKKKEIISDHVLRNGW